MLVQGVEGDEFYISLACGAAERARAAGATLDVETPAKFDATLQAPLVAAVIAKRPDAVLIAPTDRQVMVEPLRRMRSAGIKVIEVDTGVVDGTVSASSVASDNLQGGRMAARSLITLTGGKGSYLVINVKPGVSTTTSGRRASRRRSPRSRAFGTSAPGSPTTTRRRPARSSARPWPGTPV
jgi:ribose transport system substrate-binding protein